MQLKFFKRDFGGKINKGIRVSIQRVYKTVLPVDVEKLGPFSPVGKAKPRYRSVCLGPSDPPPNLVGGEDELVERVNDSQMYDNLGEDLFLKLIEDVQSPARVGIPASRWSPWFFATFLFYAERQMRTGKGIGNYEDVSEGGELPAACCPALLLMAVM